MLGSLLMPAAGHATDCAVTKGLAVDADGAPGSYRVDGKGLSRTCDGVFAIVDGVVHTQKNDKPNWQALCKAHWARAQATGDYSQVKVVGFAMGPNGPLIQKTGDPLPGLAYITTTSLRIPGMPANTQRLYVDATAIPYVVLPPKYAAAHGIALGDLVLVYRFSTRRLAYGVYAECCSLGEASVKLHEDLGSNPVVIEADGTRRAKHGIGDPVAFIPIKGSHVMPTVDAKRWRADIKGAGDAALARLGGLTAVASCNRMSN